MKNRKNHNSKSQPSTEAEVGHFLYFDCNINHEYQTNDILNKESLQIEKIFHCNLNRYMPAFSKADTSSVF